MSDYILTTIYVHSTSKKVIFFGINFTLDSHDDWIIHHIHHKIPYHIQSFSFVFRVKKLHCATINSQPITTAGRPLHPTKPTHRHSQRKLIVSVSVCVCVVPAQE